MTLTFIAATGTDIGKTYITCLLIKNASKMGKTVRGVKPVISALTKIKLTSPMQAIFLMPWANH